LIECAKEQLALATVADGDHETPAVWRYRHSGLKVIGDLIAGRGCDHQARDSPRGPGGRAKTPGSDRNQDSSDYKGCRLGSSNEGSPAYRDTDRSAPLKKRCVPSSRQFDHQIIADPFRLIIFLEFGTKLSRLNANNRVKPGVERTFPIENFHADDILFEFFGPALQAILHHEVEKSSQPFRFFKGPTREDSIPLFSNGGRELLLWRVASHPCLSSAIKLSLIISPIRR
jgi:hypothetical protein